MNIEGTKKSIESYKRHRELNSTVKCYGSEAINTTLREHEENIEDWKYQALAKELYRWIDLFDKEFKLQLYLPVIVLEETRVNSFATYRLSRSGFGTHYTITINTNYIDRPFHHVLRTLLHEQIHQWQELYGRLPSRINYHNKQYRQKAKECGIIVDSAGHTLGHTEIFSRILSKYGINVPKIEEVSKDERKCGKSKLKKWICGCTNIWCAVDLHAQCLKCGNNFVKEIK
jgi:hypothetical protein